MDFFLWVIFPSKLSHVQGVLFDISQNWNTCNAANLDNHSAVYLLCIFDPKYVDKDKKCLRTQNCMQKTQD